MFSINVKVLNKGSKEFPVRRSLTIHTSGIGTAIIKDFIFFAGLVTTINLLFNYTGIGGVASAIVGIFFSLVILVKIMLLYGSHTIYMDEYDSDILRDEVGKWLDQLDEDVADIHAKN